jgi:hypothetical protein
MVDGGLFISFWPGNRVHDIRPASWVEAVFKNCEDVKPKN